MITMVGFTNTSITSYNYYFFFQMRTFKIYSIINFQVYNAVLTTITMLHIRCPELIHLY